MPIRLSADERKQFDALVIELGESDQALASAIESFNGVMRDAWADVQEKLDAHNDARGSMREFMEDCVSNWRNQIEEKSEKWQEGAKGLAASEFADTWENAGSELDDFDLDQPEDFDADTNLPDFDKLPQKPDADA